MYILVPPFILQNYAAGRTSGRFAALGLFVDISGFTAMTDVLMEHGQHGAEVMAQVMRAAFAPLISAVYEQGGFIALHAGDSFTAVFPADAYPSQVARRAVSAAWLLQSRAAQSPSYATPYGEFPVSVKAGLALGEVQWGVVTSQDSRRAACYFRGSAIDGCAAAEHHTQPGQVVIDRGCHDLLFGWGTAIPQGDYWRIAALPVELPAPMPIAQPEIDLELAGRFLPPDLFTQSYSGEFRQVVFLFVSLRQEPDPHGLQRFMQNVFYLQDRYGGHLKLLFGDKGAHLLLLWGAPLAYENDIDRALNFILELRASAGFLLSAAITYRIAHAGFIGSELSGEYAGYGRGVNLAARFMTAAGVGEIWLDEFAARKAQVNFEIDPHGRQVFKGFSQPQPVYLLRRRKEAVEITYQGRLVGRQAELERLAAFVQPLLRGEFAGALVVWGEAGMGKSRLVHEFLSAEKFDFSEENEFLDPMVKPQVFLAQTDAILRTALNPFRYWLRRYFGISVDESEECNRRSFDDRLDDLIARTPAPRLAEEIQRTRSFLGALLGLNWPGSLYEQFDARQRFENTLLALTSLLQAESLQQPVILLLEDAHWLDDESKAYLPRLLRSFTADERIQYPLAILATARFEGPALPLDASGFQKIHLTTLDRPALAALACELLGKAAADDLLDLLEARSGGNPFFAEQILRYLQDENLLDPDSTGGALKPLQSGAVLPADANALLVARLDRLAQNLREMVLTAAILGREFEVRLLAYMLRDDVFLPEGLAQGEQEALWAALSEMRYIFRHAMLRDAAYNMQVLTRRQALHAVALEALEILYAPLLSAAAPTDLAARYSELAYHAEQGGIGEKARLYLHQAGDAATAAYQNLQALESYTRALALTPPDDLPARFTLLAAREDILEILGRQEERLRDIEALETLADQLGERGRQVEVSLRRADYLYQTGMFAAASERARQASAQAQELGEWLLAVLAYNRQALADMRQDHYTNASEIAGQGLALARKHNMHYQETWLLTTQGMIALERRDLALARRCFQDSLANAQLTGDQHSQAQALNNLGMVANYQGDYQTAHQSYQQALRIARQMGVRTGEAIVLGNLGYVLGMLGNYDLAYHNTQEQLRISREIGNLYNEAYGLFNLTSYALALGRIVEAQRHAQEGLERIRQVGEASGEAWAFTYLGHSRFAAGQTVEAQTAYQTAAVIRRQHQQPLLATEPLAGLARCALTHGDLAAAQAHLQPVLEYLDRAGSLDGVDDPLRVYLTCYLVLAQAGKERAAAILTTAHDLLQQRAELIEDQAARKTFLENIEVNRLILEAWRYTEGNEQPGD